MKRNLLNLAVVIIVMLLGVLLLPINSSASFFVNMRLEYFPLSTGHDAFTHDYIFEISQNEIVNLGVRQDDINTNVREVVIDAKYLPFSQQEISNPLEDYSYGYWSISSIIYKRPQWVNGDPVSGERNSIYYSRNDTSANVYTTTSQWMTQRLDLQTFTSYENVVDYNYIKNMFLDFKDQHIILAGMEYPVLGATPAFSSYRVQATVSDIYDTLPVATPEPGTMLLMGAGIAGAAFMRRRKAKSAN